jgi:glycosyltransferase involved in cell wall biosynthesis
MVSTSDKIRQELERRFLLQNEYLGNEKPVNKQEPLVSITVPTYQHTSYIGQCIESILMQKTNFPYEIIIGEDESVDGTREICIGYAEKHPDKIRLFLRDRNISHYKYEQGRSMRFNGIFNRMSSRGKYIAWCEGDDYWLSPNKLQKQVDLLERHVECSICFHRALRVDESGKSFGTTWPFGHIKTFTEIRDLLLFNYISTQTCMFRNGLIDLTEFVELADGLYFGDWILHMLNAKHGKIGFINEIMAAYRATDNGLHLSTQLEKQYQHRIIFYNRLESHLDTEYKDAICNGKMFTEADFAKSFYQTGEISLAKEALKKSFSARTLNYKVNEARLKAMLQIYFPLFYDAVRLLKYN